MKLVKHILTCLICIALAPTAMAFDFYSGGICYDVIGEREVAVVGAWQGVENCYEGSIILPEHVYFDDERMTVTTIADSAFWQSAVTEVQIPNSVTYIGVGAFAEATELSNVTLPMGLVTVSPYAFAGTAIENIAIPEGVRHIGTGAFAECAHLRTVFVPSGVQSIGASVFDDCFSLMEIYCAAANPPIVRGELTNIEDIDLVLPNARAEQAYRSSEQWNTERRFNYWSDEYFGYALHTEGTLEEDGFFCQPLGNHLAYRVYDRYGYQVALTAADRIYLPMVGFEDEYVVVPTNLMDDDEDGQLICHVPADIIEPSDVPQTTHPIITSYDGSIYIFGDNHGTWTEIYDVYGLLYYQRPTIKGHIDYLPGGRYYIVKVGDYAKKVFVR